MTFYPYFLVHAEGKENVPRKGPVLMLCNHQSFLDPILCQIPIRRHSYFIARNTLYDNAILKRLLPTLYSIPIRRGEADIAAMRKIIAVLKQDRMACLFPEGTRSNDGRLNEVKAGFSLLSRRGKAIVVPVVIEGAFQCWPRGRKLPKPGRISLKYGKGFTPEEIKELGDEEFCKAFNTRFQEMQGELRKKRGLEPFDYSE